MAKKPVEWKTKIRPAAQTLCGLDAASYLGFSYNYFYTSIAPQLPKVISRLNNGKVRSRYTVYDLEMWISDHRVVPPGHEEYHA